MSSQVPSVVSTLQESTQVAVESEAEGVVEPLPQEPKTIVKAKTKITFFIFIFYLKRYLLVKGPRPFINILILQIYIFFCYLSSHLINF